MKTAEMRALSSEELTKQLEAAHKELFDLRFRLSTKQLVNHRQMRKVKTDVARLKTLLRERELTTRQVSDG
ncbi:MAG: 50S ribosomal protein L29 [Chloroflexi bacterium]|nr:50S ribosomal protein L29 [Chloroflexota bacterium]